MWNERVGWRLVTAGVLVCSAAAAQAGTVTFDFSDPYDPDLAAGQTIVRAKFEDTAANTVTLTMSDVSMTSTEFVGNTGFYFNLNPLINPAALAIAYVSGQAAQSVHQVADDSKAGGDGYFDIVFDFDSAESTGNRFTRLETSVYTLTATGLTAADFNFGSVNSSISFLAAVHVQGTTGDTRFSGNPNSVWLAPGAGTVVPLPSAVWMGLLGLGGLGLLRLRRRRSLPLDV